MNCYFSLSITLFLERVNLMVWDVKNMLILMMLNLIMLILVAGWCYSGNFICHVFIIISPIFLFLKVSPPWKVKLKIQPKQNVQAQAANKEKLKYLFEVLKGLYQWLIFFFPRTRIFLNAAIYFHLTWECFWQHAFLRNMNSYRNLSGFTLNLLIS